MGLFVSRSKLRILFVTSEENPFAKVGGLGEVMFALPRALRQLGHDARVMIPRYGTIDPGAYGLTMELEGLLVPTAPDQGGRRLQCNVQRFNQTADPHSAVTTYFLENQEYYEQRSNVYGYADDRVRFALLSAGALAFLNAQPRWLPQVIVSTDWITGALPNLLRAEYGRFPRLRPVATVFSIHNLGNQGTSVHHRFVSPEEADDGHGPIPDFFSERMRHINAVRRGIRYADLINAVSRTHAQEIMTEEFGEGLDSLLRERRDRVFGIVNGIDYETNDPASDPLLSQRYSASSLPRRPANKTALQERFGLPPRLDAFTIGVVSRLTRQKGFNLLAPVIEPFLRATGSQLVLVGTGDLDLMKSFQQLELAYPDQVRAHLRFSDSLPSLIYAGADVVLIPSSYEPCGLTQMEAMRYGAIPVARRVGGLADTIADYDPAVRQGTGFLFDDFEPMALLLALTRAFACWQHRDAWAALQRRAMEQDFSWQASAREYEKLFQRAIAKRQEDLLRGEAPDAAFSRVLPA